MENSTGSAIDEDKNVQMGQNQSTESFVSVS